MRSRLFGYSIGVTFCVASLVAAVSSCGRLDNDPEDQLESESAALEQVPAGDALRTLVPGTRLDRRQLVALLGEDGVPSNLDVPCDDPTDFGTVCHEPAEGILRACSGFSDACDSTGTKDVLPINFFCLPPNPFNPTVLACTAVVQQTPETRPCTVPTEGKACSTGCGSSFCLPYDTQCDEHTNEVRNCSSNGHCSNDVCANQTVTQEIVGTCDRETDGHSCTLQNPLERCQFPKLPLCNVNGLCACLLGQQ